MSFLLKGELSEAEEGGVLVNTDLVTLCYPSILGRRNGLQEPWELWSDSWDPLPDVEAYEFLERFAGINTLWTGFSGVC